MTKSISRINSKLRFISDMVKSQAKQDDWVPTVNFDEVTFCKLGHIWSSNQRKKGKMRNLRWIFGKCVSCNFDRRQSLIRNMNFNKNSVLFGAKNSTLQFLHWPKNARAPSALHLEQAVSRMKDFFSRFKVFERKPIWKITESMLIVEHLIRSEYAD